MTVTKDEKGSMLFLSNVIERARDIIRAHGWDLGILADIDDAVKRTDSVFRKVAEAEPGADDADALKARLAAVENERDEMRKQMLEELARADVLERQRDEFRDALDDIVTSLEASESGDPDEPHTRAYRMAKTRKPWKSAFGLAGDAWEKHIPADCAGKKWDFGEVTRRMATW